MLTIITKALSLFYYILAQLLYGVRLMNGRQFFPFAF